jgi:hypothetical protein
MICNRFMRKIFFLFLFSFAVAVCADDQTNSPAAGGSSAPTVETLVCIRHGEKPPGGLGQLSCRGLNRALALPAVLLKKYGQPDFIFAPAPTPKVDGKITYNYVRPLMTIEPTAIRCGLPVNTEFGFREIAKLESELAKDKYRTAVVFIAWEHAVLDDFAKDLLKSNGGDPAKVPAWPSKDFDSIFLFKITRSNGHASISFTLEKEGLNNLSNTCP